MFSLTHINQGGGGGGAFCYRGSVTPDGEALRAVRCNRIPVTNPPPSHVYVCFRTSLPTSTHNLKRQTYSQSAKTKNITEKHFPPEKPVH